MLKHSVVPLAALITLTANTLLAQAAADAAITLGAVGTTAYTVTATTDPLIAPLGVNNPALSLEIGKRYRITNAAQSAHPFSIIARGATVFEDTPLLTQGAPQGSAEPVPGIGWLDTGADMYFTLTPQLVDFLTAGGKTPGYRCTVHTGSMRGAIAFRPQNTAFAWAGSQQRQVETFENAQVGASLTDAFADWVIVTDDPSYQARISSLPASTPGQLPTSTRWLTITDSHDAAGNMDRVYTNPVVGPDSIGVRDYTWDFRMNVTETGTGTRALPIVQHFHVGTNEYVDVWGIEVTNTGVNLVLLGTDEGASGATGPTLRTELYQFSEAGFGKGNWVQVMLYAAVDASILMVLAEGANGMQKDAEFILPSFPRAEVDPKNFRFSIRNSGQGNTSTISYDELGLSTTAVGTSGAELWMVY